MLALARCGTCHPRTHLPLHPPTPAMQPGLQTPAALDRSTWMLPASAPRIPLPAQPATAAPTALPGRLPLSVGQPVGSPLPRPSPTTCQRRPTCPSPCAAPGQGLCLRPRSPHTQTHTMVGPALPAPPPRTTRRRTRPDCSAVRRTRRRPASASASAPPPGEVRVACQAGSVALIDPFPHPSPVVPPPNLHSRAGAPLATVHPGACDPARASHPSLTTSRVIRANSCRSSLARRCVRRSTTTSGGAGSGCRGPAGLLVRVQR